MTPTVKRLKKMSIDYNDYFGWYTVQVSAFKKDVHLYTSKKIVGPWIDQGVVYTIPKFSTPVFAYAVKIHPELSKKKNRIVFTYNINQFCFQDLINNIKKQEYFQLYIPYFVEVNIAKTHQLPFNDSQNMKLI